MDILFAVTATLSRTQTDLMYIFLTCHMTALLLSNASISNRMRNVPRGYLFMAQAGCTVALLHEQDAVLDFKVEGDCIAAAATGATSDNQHFWLASNCWCGLARACNWLIR